MNPITHPITVHHECTEPAQPGYPGTRFEPPEPAQPAQTWLRAELDWREIAATFGAGGDIAPHDLQVEIVDNRIVVRFSVYHEGE